MIKVNWKVGDKVKVNARYAKWCDPLPFEKNGRIYTPPKEGDVGIIVHIDRQNDAWVDFGDGDTEGWPMNYDWADIVTNEDTK